MTASLCRDTASVGGAPDSLGGGQTGVFAQAGHGAVATATASVTLTPGVQAPDAGANDSFFFGDGSDILSAMGGWAAAFGCVSAALFAGGTEIDSTLIQASGAAVSDRFEDVFSPLDPVPDTPAGAFTLDGSSPLGAWSAADFLSGASKLYIAGVDQSGVKTAWLDEASNAVTHIGGRTIIQLDDHTIVTLTSNFNVAR